MAFFLLLLYIAVLFIRPQEWIESLQGVRVLDYVAGATILTTLFVLPRLKWRLKSAPENLLMLGFFGAMLLGHVADRFNWGFFKLTFGDFGKIVLLYFLIVINTDSVNRVKAIIRVMLAGCLFMALHGILQFTKGTGFGGVGPFVDRYTGETRAQAFGFFNDPNDLALMLVVILPYLILNALNRQRVPPVRLLSGLATAPILWCIYLTNSRGGWLALAAMLVTMLYLLMKRKKVALVAAGVLVAGLIALGPSRIATISTSEGSAHTRMSLWINGNTMLKQNPLFGVGKGQFAEHSENAQVAHNSFIHCYAELGLVGYFVWLGLLLSAVKDAWAMRKGSEINEDAAEISVLATAMLAALAGYFSSSLFLSRTYIPVPYILIALIAALRTVYTRDIGELKGEFVRRDYRYVAGLMVGSIALVYVFLRTMF